MDNVLGTEQEVSREINSFQTPAMPVSKDRSNHMYSLPAVALATFLGTAFAGAFLLTRNFKRLGRKQEVGRAWLVGSILFFGCIMLSLVLPRHVPAVLYGIVQVGGMSCYTMLMMGTSLKDHGRRGGQFVSLWRVAGISMLFCLALLSCMTGVLMWRFD